MNFSKIDQLSQTLRAMRPLNATELRRLREEFAIENTYNSNAIEGSTLTLQETAFILRENVTIGGRPIREHLEAVGHKEAFEYVTQLADSHSELTERIIKQIHSLVLMHDNQNRGAYRSVPVIITGSKHTPPQPYLVQPQMETLLLDYGQIKCDKHIIEAVSEFHLRFESVHPFIDGNGRTGRLILNLELIKAGLLPIDIKFSDRQRYYQSFSDYYETGTPDTLCELVTDYEEKELEQHISILEGKSYGN
jgi:Fic family protein